MKRSPVAGLRPFSPTRAWRACIGALLLSLGCCGAAWALEEEAATICGSLHNGYGPFDYRTQRKRLSIVERYHFSSQVENLRRGDTGTIGSDMDYTLRASPNHHRALAALVRWGEKTGLPQPTSLPRPIDCYFERALRFQHDDAVARMLFAKHLINTRREALARQQLAVTDQFASDTGITNYNIGLFYAELKDWDAALAQAHKAMARGHTNIAALRKQLQAAGRWKEPPAAVAEPAAASAAATAPVLPASGPGSAP